MQNSTLRLFKRISSLKVSTVKYSSASQLVIVNKNDETGTSTISMNRPPVNALNLEMLMELKKSLESVQKDGSKGVILTSNLSKVFTGGIDIMEFYKPNVNRLTEFWTTYEEVMMMLYGLGLPTVAAINAASPAGGCILALCSEYRIIVDGNHRIGLNETQLGLAPPIWVMDMYVNIIGYRKAELAMMRGQQFSPQEALAIGLVDELVNNKEDAVNKAEKYIASYSKISSQARAQTKALLRKSQVETVTKNLKRNAENIFNYIQQPTNQTILTVYLESLTKKKK